MSLTKRKKATYLNIKEGAIIKPNKGGVEDRYDSIEAYLLAIRIVEREIKGEPRKFWQFDLKGTDGADYILSIGYRSGVVKSLLLCVSNISGEIGLLRIEAYKKNDFTKIIAYHKGERLDWSHSPEDFPPVVTLEGGAKDDYERMQFFEALADQIKAKLERSEEKL